MLAHLSSVLDRLRESLWPLPLFMAAIGAALGVAATRVEPEWAAELSWLYDAGAAQAPDFASSLVSAMITLTTLAFSITMVVLTLAAQQLGPRLIHLFMSDRGTQAALGLFLATVFYLLMVLRALGGATAPSLAITGGTALVIASIIVLLLFVHALGRSIVADQVIKRVQASLDRGIAASFPESYAKQDHAAPPQAGAAFELRARGYVQRIDYGALTRAAEKHDVVLVLPYRAGAHLIEGDAPVTICGPANEQLKQAISRAIVIAAKRTEGQDPEWAARQLVEAALRALSPSVNDPFTAIAAIDALSLSLSRLMRRGQPSGVWRDRHGKPRIFAPTPSFELLLDAAFDQIREAAEGKQRVLLRLAENLCKLSRIAISTHQAALVRHILSLEGAAKRTLPDPREMEEVLASTRDARAALAAGRQAGPNTSSAAASATHN